MEVTETRQVILGEMFVGARLLVRAKTDWRAATVSRIGETKITLTVCSPLGRTYRLHRTFDCEIIFDGGIPILVCEDTEENWRENFSPYDLRW